MLKPTENQDDSSWSSYQKLVLTSLEQLTSKQEKTEEKVEHDLASLKNILQEVSLAVQEIKQDVTRNKEEVKQLLYLVRDGNGKPSIVARLDSLERNQITVEKANERLDRDVFQRKGIILGVVASICLSLLSTIGSFVSTNFHWK